jgi:hypothetical protein
MANWRMAVQGGLHDGAVIDLPEGRYSVGRDTEQAQIVMTDPELPSRVLDIQVSASRVFLALPGVAEAVRAGAQSPVGTFPLEIKVLGRVLSSRGKVVLASAAPLGHSAVVQLTSRLSLHLNSDWVLPEKKGGLRTSFYGLLFASSVFGGGAWWYGTSALVSASTPQKPLPTVLLDDAPATVVPVSTTDVAVAPSTELPTSDASTLTTVPDSIEAVDVLPLDNNPVQKLNTVPKASVTESQSMGSYVSLGVVSIGSMDIPGSDPTAPDAMQEHTFKRRQWYLELADRTRVYEGGSLPTGQVFLTVDKRQRLWVMLSDGRRVYYSLQ